MSERLADAPARGSFPAADPTGADPAAPTSADGRAPLPASLQWLLLRPGAALAGVLALAAVVRIARWNVTAVMFNDGPIFLALAHAIADGDFATAFGHPFHPLYPLAIAAAHAFFASWETAAVAVSILGGVGAVFFLYRFVRASFGPEHAFVAAFVLAVHPGAVEYQGDLQTEGLYLALFLGAVDAVWRALQEGKASAAFWAGLLSGLAYLTRPEGAGPLVVLGLVGLGLWARGAFDFRTTLRVGVASALGFALLAGPYLGALRVYGGDWAITQKKSLSVMAGLEAPPRDGPELNLAADEDDAPRAGQRPVERPDDAPNEPEVAGPPPQEAIADPAGPPLPSFGEALFDVARTHLRALRYEGLLLLLVGLYALHGRRIGLRGATVATLVGLYCAILLALAWNVGYVSGRHALPPMAATFGYVAAGVLAVTRLASRASARRGALAFAACLLLFAGLGLGKALRPDRVDSIAERRAAEWLRAQGEPVRGVAARKRRIAYYAGAPHVKLHQEAATYVRLWAHGASHAILRDDPDLYPSLRPGLATCSVALHSEEAAGERATVYALASPRSHPDCDDL